MTALTLDLCRPPAIVAACSEAQSREGLSVQQAAERAKRHWEDRAEMHLGWSDNADDLPYRSVPMETAFVVRTRYRLVGEMAPLPYPLDE